MLSQAELYRRLNESEARCRALEAENVALRSSAGVRTNGGGAPGGDRSQEETGGGQGGIPLSPKKSGIPENGGDADSNLEKIEKSQSLERKGMTHEELCAQGEASRLRRNEVRNKYLREWRRRKRILANPGKAHRYLSWKGEVLCVCGKGRGNGVHG